MAWEKLKEFIGLNEDMLEEEAEEQFIEHSKGRERERKNNLVGFPTAVSSEVVVVEPRQFGETVKIIAYLKNRKSVVINLHHMEKEAGQRTIDFVAGATHALDGHQKRLGEMIFLFTPTSVTISELELEKPSESWLNKSPTDLFWKLDEA